MDLSFFIGATSALKGAKDIGSALLEMRDFNQSASKIVDLNRFLLQAQESLFAHNTQLLQLQNEHCEASQELRKLKEALAERGRYSLVEITEGSYAYKSKVVQAESAASSPVASEPEHYLCQPCYDKGVKSVLQRKVPLGDVFLACTICGAEYSTGLTEPQEPIRLNFRTPWE